MFRPGRRLFSIASICLILTAVAHTLGHFQPLPQDAATTNLVTTMQSYKIDLGIGMQPSALDIQNSLSLLMSVALVLLGLQNLAVARLDGKEGRIVRVFTFLNLAGIGVLVAVFWFYRIPPPLLTLAVVELLFLLAVLMPARRSG
jgi:hypothetical protein